MIGDERKTWEEIVRHARVNSGCAIQEGFVPDDGDKAILAADAELTALRSRCERLKDLNERAYHDLGERTVAVITLESRLALLEKVAEDVDLHGQWKVWEVVNACAAAIRGRK